MPLSPATVHAPEAVAATADGLATQAALEILGRGGNAVDAAIAANAVLAVTSPHLCGMGGDLFALVHDGSGPEPACLASIGRAGSGADPDRLRAEGAVVMPRRRDIRSVTVPGCVDGWLALHDRFATLPLATLLEGAIRYAELGFPASPLLVGALGRLPAEDPSAAALQAQARRAGDLVRRPGVAATLRELAAGGRDAFYGGAFGEGLLALGAGEFTADDLARPLAEWSAPARAEAWDAVLWTPPPPSQGYVTLAAAWIASGLTLPDDPDHPAWIHLLVEAAKAASFDRPDVLHDGADPVALLAAERLEPRRRAIDAMRAKEWSVPARAGDTTALCVVDRNRLGIALIQSNAADFGSHLFEPTTGINLHNRGLGFSLTPGHRAEYGPGRRPPHTLSPVLVTHPDGRLRAVVATMGGDAQPQVLLQVLTRLLRHGQAPGPALAASRWALDGTSAGFDTWTAPEGPTVVVADDAPEGWADGLVVRRHRLRVTRPGDTLFGHAHAVVVDPRGVLAGASDHRTVIGDAAGR